jgi:CHAT domain-containing protein
MCTSLVLGLLLAPGPIVIVELVDVFDRKLKEGMPKDEALQQAQVAMIGRGYSPFQWAAFQLTGDRR